MGKKTRELRDVRVGDTWAEADPRFKEPWSRIAVSVDDEHVTIAYVNGPLVGRKPVRAKRTRFNGNTSGYRLVHRPSEAEMAAALGAWSRVADTWHLGDVSVEGMANAYVHHMLARAKAGASA